MVLRENESLRRRRRRRVHIHTRIRRANFTTYSFVVPTRTYKCWMPSIGFSSSSSGFGCTAQCTYITYYYIGIADSDYLLWERATKRRLTPAKTWIHVSVQCSTIATCRSIWPIGVCAVCTKQSPAHKHKYCTQFVDKFNLSFLLQNDRTIWWKHRHLNVIYILCVTRILIHL